MAETKNGLEKTYRYDKRGNLTLIMENGQTIQQYVYGALNRLEEAVDQAGKAAKYQYNGLGHRVGRQEGKIPKEQLEHLDPRNRIKGETEIGNWSWISYTIDLTRESYGYGAFGEDLYDNQGELQPFGYTGYQKDRVAGTYYAQAREYQPSIGRFNSEDIIGGFILFLDTLNHYIYCWNNSLLYIDNDGEFPTIAIGAIVSGGFELGKQFITGEMNFKSVAIETVKGAAKGEIAGTGIGLIGAAGANGVIDAAGDFAKQTLVEGKSIENVDPGRILESFAWGAGETLAFGGMAKMTSKIKTKIGVPSRTKVSLKIKGNHKVDYDNNIDDLSIKIGKLKEKIGRYRSKGLSNTIGSPNYSKKYRHVLNELTKRKSVYRKNIKRYTLVKILDKIKGVARNEIYMDEIKEALNLDGGFDVLLEKIVAFSNSINWQVKCENE